MDDQILKPNKSAFKNNGKGGVPIYAGASKIATGIQSHLCPQTFDRVQK